MKLQQRAWDNQPCVLRSNIFQRMQSLDDKVVTREVWKGTYKPSGKNSEGTIILKLQSAAVTHYYYQFNW